MVIYALLAPAPSEEVRYVGLTRNLDRRVRQYKTASGGHNKHLRNWLRSINYQFQVRMLAEVTEGAEADQAERYWIAAYREAGASLLNYTSGGECSYVLPIEARQHLAESAKQLLAQGRHNFQNPEVRARQQAAVRQLRGRKLAVAHAAQSRARCLAWAEHCKGRPLSAEHRAAVSAGNRGRKLLEAHKVVLRDSTKARWQDPVQQEKMLIGCQKGGANPAGRIASADKRRGQPLTVEHRQKISARMQGRRNAGLVAYWAAKKLAQEAAR